MREKKKLRLILAIMMSLVIIFTSVNVPNIVLASEISAQQIVYVDGNKICVFVDEKTGNIIAQSTDIFNDSYLEISSDGDGIATVYDEEEEQYMEYLLEIDELSYDDMDIDVIDDGEIIESFDDIDDIISDSYEGQATVAVITGITI